MSGEEPGSESQHALESTDEGAPGRSGVIHRVLSRIEDTGSLEGDTRELRVRKGILTLSTLLISVAGVVWGVLYLALGIPWAAVPPLAYSALSAISFAVFARFKSFAVFRTTQLFLILLLPFAVHLALGGFAASSHVAVWAILAPLGALMFGSVAEGAGWMVAFVAAMLVAGALDVAVPGTAPPELTAAWRSTFSVMNAVAPMTIAFFMLQYLVRGDQRLRRVIAQKDREIDEARRLGPYALESKLGEGGMGAVFRARHALLRRPTAVKVIDSRLVGDILIERFEREVQATSELSHPNIVEVYDYGKSPDGDFYYAMEYLPGLDLQQLVAHSGPLPVARAIHVLFQAAEALHEAHARGLIHRDVKPANMILSQLGTRSDVLKVLDFGLVKDVGGKSEHDVTEDNTITGTPSYLSPEAIERMEQLGPPSDVYALGCVAYYLLCGQPPFAAASAARLWAAHLNDPPVPPSVKNREVPQELEQIVLKCLEKDPEKRYTDGRELSSALAPLTLQYPWSEEEARASWSTLPVKEVPQTMADAPTLPAARRASRR